MLDSADMNTQDAEQNKEPAEQPAIAPARKKRTPRRSASVENNSPWQTRIIGHEMVDPRALLGHPDNWRIHPAHQREILRGGLEDLGWVKSIQVQKSTMTIVDGHARVFVAVMDDVPFVPVEYVDLTDAEVKKAIASLDSISGLADPDFKALGRTLEGIGETDPRLATLFDDLEAQVADAVKMELQYEGRTKTNFHSVQKAFKDRKVVIKAVFALQDAEQFEDALEATGKINRAEAMAEIAKHYLSTKGKHHDGDKASELDLAGKIALEARIAKSLGR